MSIPTVGVIPTRDRFDLLAPLVAELLSQDELDLLLIFDNSEAQDVVEHLVAHEKLDVYEAPGLSIYQMWNLGWEVALDRFEGDVNVAFLNDDLRIPPLFLSELAVWLRCHPNWWAVYPDYSCDLQFRGFGSGPLRETQGTFKDGGMSGFAFMLRGELARWGPLTMFDDTFEIWYGDDDLVRNINTLGGKVGRVIGLPIEHVQSATVNLHPELQAAMGRDAVRWQEKIKS